MLPIINGIPYRRGKRSILVKIDETSKVRSDLLSEELSLDVVFATVVVASKKNADVRNVARTAVYAFSTLSACV
jgi:hypothetical protein